MGDEVKNSEMTVEENAVQEKTAAGENISKEKKKGSFIVKMIIGSALGLLLFCVPLPWGGGESEMLLSFIKTNIENLIKPALGAIALGVMAIAFVGTLVALATKGKKHSDFFNACFHPSPVNIIVRAAALVISFLVFTGWGPYWLISEDTGGLMFGDLMPSLLLFFYLGTVLLHFLTDFGLMELVGCLVERFFRPLFRIPARSVLLCISAWFGSGTVQLIPIEAEYKSGYLTGREAAIISVSFCTIPFGAYLVYSCGIAGLENGYFGGMVLALAIVTVIGTIIMCRIPPLSRIPDTYYEGKKRMYEEGKGGIRKGFSRAYEKVKTAPSIGRMFKHGSGVAVNLYFEVFPLIIALGTLVTVLTAYTPIFQWIATPFVPLLEAIGVPDAVNVAPALFTGFADLLLPFITAAGIESQLATFILCVVGCAQIICMTETGLVMVKSAVPLTVGKLFLIFLEKTVIALFVALLIGTLMGIPA